MELLSSEEKDEFNDLEKEKVMDLSSLLLTSDDKPVDYSHVSKIMISRYMQGSTETLSNLVAQISERALADLRTLTQAECQLPTELLRQLEKSFDPMILDEQIKQIGERKIFGYWEKEGSIGIFEDVDPLAVLRWEVYNQSVFSSSRQAVCKEAKSLRMRHGKLIVSVSKLIKQLQKTPGDQAKIQPLDDKYNKANRDVEAAKQKRRDLENKKAADAHAKLRKEQEREAKKKEKQEKDALNALAKEKVAAEKAQAAAAKDEEEMKKKAALNKQKMAMSMFIKKAPSITPQVGSFC